MTERFLTLKIDHLHLNYPSGQLSPRTPPATFIAGTRTNASLDSSSNLSRHNSIPAKSAASRCPSIFYSFVFNIF